MICQTVNTAQTVHLENFKEVDMRKDYKEYICDDCKYLGYGVKRNGNEYYYCMCEDSGGTDDAFSTACKHLLLEDEELEDEE